MAVNGVGSAGSIYGSRNVFSGLASGLDTESMIKNATMATRLKIQQQQQQKQLLGWKQESYRGISSKLHAFSKKYTDYTSSTNLLSNAFFNSSITTTVGPNKDLISATGKTSSKVEIVGVGQMASAGSHTINGLNSGKQVGNLQTGEVDLSKEQEFSKLAGSSMSFTYGSKNYTITLDPEAKLDSAQAVADEINKQLNKVEVSGQNGTKYKLGDKIKVSTEGEGDNAKLKFASEDTAGNSVKIQGASQAIADALNLGTITKDGIDLTKDDGFTTSTPVTRDKLVGKKDPLDAIKNQSITLDLNGERKTIKLIDDSDYEKLLTHRSDSNKLHEEFKKIAQEKLDRAFGKDKVTLDMSSKDGKYQFTFKTKNDNDVIKVAGGDSALVGGHSVLGLKGGDSNRINRNSTLEQLGIITGDGTRADAKEDLIINGIKVGSFGKDSTLSDVMNAINDNQELGVEVTYSELSNEFKLTTKDTGAGRGIQIEKGGLADKLFGATEDANKEESKVKSTQGTDAIVYANINDKTVVLERGSNTFDIDGLKVTVNNTFGMDNINGGDAKDPSSIKDGFTVKDPSKNVTFSTKPDTDKIVDAIKDMVKDYNEIMDLVYKEMTTKPNKEFKPLTDEQREQMSESQIEKWEEKAKEGLLYQDPQIRDLHNSMRFIFSPGGQATQALRNMGISVVDSLDPKEGGKIQIDEQKLRSAIEGDLDGVMNAFTALAEEGSENAGILEGEKKGGVMTQMKRVTDRFASDSLVTPGILVRRAGMPESPTSMMKNALQTEMDRADSLIKTLNSKLSKEVDRYNKQFTRLEQLVAQMNAQSAQLAGFMGG